MPVDEDLIVTCRRLARGLHVAEACSLTISLRRFSIVLEGNDSLQCLSVDQVDGVAMTPRPFSHAVGPRPAAAADDDLLVIVASAPEPDMVLLLAPLSSELLGDEGTSTSEFVWRYLRLMKERRAAKTAANTPTKAIFYRTVDPPLAELLRADVADGYIKWSRGDVALTPIPFQHSRLDFLKFHRNRSVMSKLSGHGDSAIELSCDDVRAVGDAFPYPVDCNMSCLRNRLPNTRELVFDLLHSDAAVEKLVLIVSDRALYVTKATGAVVCRISFESLVDHRLVTSPPLAAAAVANNERHSSNKLSNGGVGGGAAVVLNYRSDAGKLDALAIATKYAPDVFNKIKAPRSPSAGQRGSVDDPLAPSTGNGAALEAAAVVVPCVSASIQTQPVEMANASTMTVAQHLQDDSVHPLLALASDTSVDDRQVATVYVLSQRIMTLMDQLRERDVTIRLLQQRCAIQVQVQTKDAPPSASAASTPVPVGPAQPSLSSTRAGGRVASRSPSSTKKRDVPQVTAPQGPAAMPSTGALATREDELESLRHYVAMLETHLQRFMDSDAERHLRELEDAALSDSSDNAKALRVALIEAVRNEALLRRHITKLQTEVSELTSATNRVLSEMGDRVTRSISDFVVNFERHRLGDGESSVLCRVLNSIDRRESVVQQEVATRLAEANSTNATLVRELRERDLLLERLSQLAGLDGENGAQQRATASFRQSVAELYERRNNLDHTVRSLARRIDDLQQTRDALVDELDLSAARMATDNAAARELQILRHQVAVLQSLQNVPLAVNRLASLELLALQATNHKREVLVSHVEKESAVKDLSGLHSQLDTANKEIAKLRQRVVSADKQCMDLVRERDGLQQRLAAMSDEGEKKEKELKKTIRYQQSRVHDLVQSRKTRQSTLMDLADGASTPRTAAATPRQPSNDQICSPHSASAASPPPMQQTSRVQQLEDALRVIQKNRPEWSASPQPPPPQDDRSAHRSPPRHTDPVLQEPKWHDAFEQQRRNFEKRLQDLEMAYQAAPSGSTGSSRDPDAVMGVVRPTPPPASGSFDLLQSQELEIAKLRAENTLLRHASPAAGRLQPAIRVKRSSSPSVSRSRESLHRH